MLLPAGHFLPTGSLLSEMLCPTSVLPFPTPSEALGSSSTLCLPAHDASVYYLAGTSFPLPKTFLQNLVQFTSLCMQSGSSSWLLPLSHLVIDPTGLDIFCNVIVGGCLTLISNSIL